MAEARDTARVLALAWEGTRKRSISNNSAKRRRASKAKVKTGCRTCKIRRVKCDETKPFCNRCRKFGRGCDGYEADEPPSDEPEKTPHVAKFRPLLKKRVLPITTQPAIQVFHTGEEFRCFQLYCEDAAPRLSGVLGGSLWCRLLLQAGHDQPFIQHAIFTIGALSKMLKGGGLGQFKIETTNPTTSDDILMKKYHGFALWHYDKFIQGTRSHILNGEQGRRMALIACLLVVCIESLQNHAEAALRHARAGTELMHEFLIANTVVPPDSAEEEVIEWNGNLKALPGISSPAPHIIEDELVQQFNRLHMQNLAVFDFQAPEEHSRLKREGTRTIRVMPTVFSNTDDARLFLELITRRSYHYMSERLLTQHIAVGNLMNNTSTFSDEDSDSAITTPKSIDDSPFRQDQVQIEHEIYHSENRRWSQAFEPLFRETQLKPSHPEALSASLLKIHSLALNIRLASHITSSELIYDKFLPEFRQMIDLGKALLQQVEQRIFDDGSFIFDMGLTYDLSLVQLSCRDRGLRREALALLSGKNWKEGSWGSKTCADIASYIMEVEEEGVETEYIPEEARARLIGCEVDVENRRATLRVVQGTGEKRRFRSCTRDWSSMF